MPLTRDTQLTSKQEASKTGEGEGVTGSASNALPYRFPDSSQVRSTYSLGTARPAPLLSVYLCNRATNARHNQDALREFIICPAADCHAAWGRQARLKLKMVRAVMSKVSLASSDELA